MGEVLKDHHSCSGRAEVRLAAEAVCGKVWVAEQNLGVWQVHVALELW